MKNYEIKKAAAAVNIIAEKESLSVEDVRIEMMAAIAEGMSSSDPVVKEMWNNVPCKGEVPEPEELIAWLTEQVREMVMV